jgi:hypothetical protein
MFEVKLTTANITLSQFGQTVIFLAVSLYQSFIDVAVY